MKVAIYGGNRKFVSFLKKLTAVSCFDDLKVKSSYTHSRRKYAIPNTWSKKRNIAYLDNKGEYNATRLYLLSQQVYLNLIYGQRASILYG